jgi:hypothetical protein
MDRFSHRRHGVGVVPVVTQGDSLEEDVRRGGCCRLGTQRLQRGLGDLDHGGALGEMHRCSIGQERIEE